MIKRLTIALIIIISLGVGNIMGYVVANLSNNQSLPRHSQ